MYTFIKPTHIEKNIRRRITIDLQRAVRSRWPDAHIELIGSIACNLYLPTADMDFVLLSEQFSAGGRPKYDPSWMVFDFEEFLTKRRMAKRNSIECRAGARVGIVRYIRARDNLFDEASCHAVEF